LVSWQTIFSRYHLPATSRKRNARRCGAARHWTI